MNIYKIVAFAIFTIVAVDAQEENAVSSEDENRENAEEFVSGVIVNSVDAATGGNEVLTGLAEDVSDEIAEAVVDEIANLLNFDTEGEGSAPLVAVKTGW